MDKLTEGNKKKSDSQTKRLTMVKRILRMTSHNGSLWIDHYSMNERNKDIERFIADGLIGESFGAFLAKDDEKEEVIACIPCCCFRH